MPAEPEFAAELPVEFSVAVFVIKHDWKFYRGKMPADLMPAARSNLDLNQTA